MLTAEDDLKTALNESGGRRWRFSAYRGATLNKYDLPTQPQGDLTFDATAVIQCTGTVYAVDGGTPDTLVPKALTDPLAPAGQELLAEYIVTAGAREWSIPAGKLPIVSVPDMAEQVRKFPTRTALLSSSVQLDLRDRFDSIRSADFLQPEAPQSTSTWGEIQRLSPFPILRNIPDVTLPPSVAYADSRLDALQLLFDNLGAEPALSRLGYLTARVKDAYLTATVPVFAISGVVSIGRSMTNNLYNAVRVRTVVGDNTILSVKTINDPNHALYIGGPFGVRTYGYSSPLITDQASADAAATTILARVSSQHARTVKVRCLPNPLIELGDYGTATDTVSGLTVSGEVVGMTLSLDATAPMDLTMISREVWA